MGVRWMARDAARGGGSSCNGNCNCNCTIVQLYNCARLVTRWCGVGRGGVVRSRRRRARSAVASLAHPIPAHSSTFHASTFHSSTFQHTPAHSSTLQHIPAHSSTFHYIPLHYITLRRSAVASLARHSKAYTMAVSHTERGIYYGNVWRGIRRGRATQRAT